MSVREDTLQRFREMRRKEAEEVVQDFCARVGQITQRFLREQNTPDTQRQIAAHIQQIFQDSGIHELLFQQPPWVVQAEQNPEDPTAINIYLHPDIKEMISRVMGETPET